MAQWERMIAAELQPLAPKFGTLNSHSRLIIQLPPCVADNVDFYGFHCNRRKPKAKPLNSMAPPMDNGRYHPVRYPTLYAVHILTLVVHYICRKLVSTD